MQCSGKEIKDLELIKMEVQLHVSQIAGECYYDDGTHLPPLPEWTMLCVRCEEGCSITAETSPFLILKNVC